MLEMIMKQRIREYTRFEIRYVFKAVVFLFFIQHQLPFIASKTRVINIYIVQMKIFTNFWTKTLFICLDYADEFHIPNNSFALDVLPDSLIRSVISRKIAFSFRIIFKNCIFPDNCSHQLRTVVNLNFLMLFL